MSKNMLFIFIVVILFIGIFIGVIGLKVAEDNSYYQYKIKIEDKIFYTDDYYEYGDSCIAFEQNKQPIRHCGQYTIVREQIAK